MKPCITLQAIVNTWTGYGQMLCETVAELSYRGWDVLIKPLRVEETCFGVDARIPLEIKDRFVGEHTADWEITLAPLDRPHIPTPGKKAIYCTMWEHDRLASWQSAILNKCEAVIVPTEWMRTVFKKTIKVPIHVVPLGINPTIFLPTNLPIDGPCVFGAAGCLTASAKRKNLGAVVNAFNHVFKNVPDVELRLKIMPGETFDPGPGPIRVNAEYAPWSSVARWLHGLTAFVNVGTEGWGLCLDSKTPIRTNNGFKDIEAIQAGDEVLTVSGFKKVTATQIRPYQGQMIEITVDGRPCEFPLRVTPDHQILTTNGWKKAIDLRGDDILVRAIDTFPKKNRNSDRYSRRRIDLAEYCPEIQYCRDEFNIAG